MHSRKAANGALGLGGRLLQGNDKTGELILGKGKLVTVLVAEAEVLDAPAEDSLRHSDRQPG